MKTNPYNAGRLKKLFGMLDSLNESKSTDNDVFVSFTGTYKGKIIYSIDCGRNIGEKTFHNLNTAVTHLEMLLADLVWHEMELDKS